MSVIDEVLAANEIYSRTHELRKLTPRPQRTAQFFQDSVVRNDLTGMELRFDHFR